MPNQPLLDQIFRALAHPARRHVIEVLGRGAASVTDLAEPLKMAMPSFMEHLNTLEDCGLVHSEKTGRVRIYRLEPEPLIPAQSWLEARRSQWTSRLDQLDRYLIQL